MRENVRGYCGVGVYNPKHECNHNTIYRSAFNFGANFLFQIGGRYKATKADTTKSYKHLPFWQFDHLEQLLDSQPKDSCLVGVELHHKAHSLTDYIHPERAIYLLGSEDAGLPENILEKCHHIIQIPSVTRESLNVAVAGSILLYDRFYKRKSA